MSYAVSKYRYLELKYFCLQYEKMKKENPKNAEMIEQCCLKAAPGWYGALLKNVTYGIAYEFMPVPCGRRQFYESRSAFFKFLSKQRK